MTETATTSRARRFRARIPQVLVWYCRIVALASILSALSPRTNDRIDRLPDYILFSLGFLLGVPSIGFGVLMLMLGAAIRRRKRVAWWLLMVLGLFVGPLGWVGQPTWVQRLERIVKLGSVPSRPLFLMYAARRELTPAAGSERNRATTNSPSGRRRAAPRRRASVSDSGTTAKHASRVTGAPMIRRRGLYLRGKDRI